MNRNKELKTLMASARGEITVLGEENVVLRKQNEGFEQSNKELKKKQIENERKIMSLKAQLYQKNFEGVEEDWEVKSKSLDNIFSEYEKKIEDMEKVLQGDEEK